jgi:putative acyl-CoA dehydrogenase
MRSVLADLALELEAVVALLMRLCRAFDRAAGDPAEAAYARLLTPAVKYWVCKGAPGFIYEAMECLGGNGYVEEAPLARLYREAPVNAIWEGSGNVMCLDVIRALSREADAAQALLGRLARATTDLPGSAGNAARLDRTFRKVPSESDARYMVECLALLAATAALVENAPRAIAERFALTRLMHRHGALYGAAELDDGASELLARALP